MTVIVAIVRLHLWRVGNAIALRWQRRRMAARLAGLDNRTLKDIGVSRSEIHHLVNNPPRRRRLVS